MLIGSYEVNMGALKLPESLSSLVEHLQVVEFTWREVRVQLPKFAIYACLPKPVFDQMITRKGYRMAILKFGRYRVPILDPFRDDLSFQPNFVIIISHCRDNRFGLYGYPADTIDTAIELPHHHSSVPRIVKNFI
jgi:hypothetical protein